MLSESLVKKVNIFGRFLTILPANMFRKGEMVNTLSFGGHHVSVTTMQLCLCGVASAIDNM